MIVYTCPNCGGDLVDYVITTYPSIQAKKCLRCGWRWESQTSPICRIRFEPSKEKHEHTD